jgi:hypothetical protein
MAKIAPKPTPDHIPEPALVKKGKENATLSQKVKIFFQSLGNAITHRGHSAAYYFERLGIKLVQSENSKHINEALEALGIDTITNFITDPKNKDVINLKFPGFDPARLKEIALEDPQRVFDAKAFHEGLQHIEQKLGIGKLPLSAFKDFTPDDFTKLSAILQSLGSLGLNAIVKSTLQPQDIQRFLALPLSDLVNQAHQYKKTGREVEFLEVATRFFARNPPLQAENLRQFISITRFQQPMAFVLLLEKCKPEMRPFIFHFSSHIETALQAKTSIGDILNKLSKVQEYATHLKDKHGYDEKACIKVLQKQPNALNLDFNKDVLHDQCFVATIQEQAKTPKEQDLAIIFCSLVTNRYMTPKQGVQKFFVDVFNNLQKLAATHGTTQVVHAMRLSAMAFNMEKINEETNLELALTAPLRSITLILESLPKIIDSTAFTHIVMDKPFTTAKPVIIEYLRQLGIKETDIPTLTTFEETANSFPPLLQLLEQNRRFLPGAIPVLQEIYANKGEFPLLYGYIDQAKDFVKTGSLPTEVIPYIMEASSTVGSIIKAIMDVTIVRLLIKQLNIDFKDILSWAKLIVHVPNIALETVIGIVIDLNKKLPKEYKLVIKKCLPDLVKLVKVALPPIIDGHKEIAQKVLDFLMNSEKYLDEKGWKDEAAVRELVSELIAEIQNKDISKLLPGLYAVAHAAKPAD